MFVTKKFYDAYAKMTSRLIDDVTQENRLLRSQVSNLTKQLAEAKRRDGKGRFVSSKEGDFLTR